MNDSQPARLPPVFLVVLALAAFALRFAHNEAMLESPLYFHPLGGHVVYLQLAGEIARGSWLPPTAHHFSSPLFPYYLAAIGPDHLVAIRLVGIALDSLTCVLIALLAQHAFGRTAGVIAGVFAAVYAPFIFFSAELVEVAPELFLVVLGYALLFYKNRAGAALAAGICLGLSCGMHPNNALIAGLAALTPWCLGKPRAARLGLASLAGTAVVLAALVVGASLSAGELTPMTRTAAINFYLGHMPVSGAGLILPRELQGDVFAKMREAAEGSAGHPLSEAETSHIYAQRGLDAIAADPAAELHRLWLKAKALVSRYEAETYVNFYYEKELSPWLRDTPDFAVLIPAAAAGLLFGARRRTWPLFGPVMATGLIILTFFFMARLRITMVPFLIILAAGACAGAFEAARQRRFVRLTAMVALVTAVAAVSASETSTHDTSNEWNKVGALLRSEDRPGEAEAAFQHALASNPVNPDTYLNLAGLYRAQGDAARADDAKAHADHLLHGD